MYEIRLFGKCSFIRNGGAVTGLPEGKAQNLLCYLLVNRGRTHSRESLASLFWGDHPTVQSKKYLRTAVWQVRSALQEPEEGELLLISADSARINPNATIVLDVAEFEQAYLSSQPLPGKKLEPAHIHLLQKAVDLYRGDLMEGCYEDWCLYERERLQNMYLAILDKLLSVCEEQGDSAAGWKYAACILRHDPACERTHQRLMRLYYQAGDRASGLRQYERCVTALRNELGVKPSRQTVELYERICADDLQERARTEAFSSPAEPSAPPDNLFSRLRRVRRALFSLHRQLEEEIVTLDSVLRPDSSPAKPVRRLSSSPQLRLRRPAK